MKFLLLRGSKATGGWHSQQRQVPTAAHPTSSARSQTSAPTLTAAAAAINLSSSQTNIIFSINFMLIFYAKVDSGSSMKWPSHHHLAEGAATGNCCYWLLIFFRFTYAICNKTPKSSNVHLVILINSFHIHFYSHYLLSPTHWHSLDFRSSTEFVLWNF